MTTGSDTITGGRRLAGTGALRVFSVLNGLLVLGVLVQGMSGGGFLGGAGGLDWLQLHKIGPDVVEVLALLAAIVAVARLRQHRAIAVWSPVLIVLLVVQHGLGGAISRGHRDLVAVHVPVAMLIMGLGVYLSVAGALARRSSSVRDT